MCVCKRERERERERETHTHTQTERERETNRQTERCKAEQPGLILHVKARLNHSFSDLRRRFCGKIRGRLTCERIELLFRRIALIY